MDEALQKHRVTGGVARLVFPRRSAVNKQDEGAASGRCDQPERGGSRSSWSRCSARGHAVLGRSSVRQAAPVPRSLWEEMSRRGKEMREEGGAE